MAFQRMFYLDMLELFKIGEELLGYSQEGTVHSVDDGSITGCSWVLTSLKGDGEEKSFQIKSPKFEFSLEMISSREHWSEFCPKPLN